MYFGNFLKITEFYLQIDTIIPTKVVSVFLLGLGVIRHACSNNEVSHDRLYAYISRENCRF